MKGPEMNRHIPVQSAFLKVSRNPWLLGLSVLIAVAVLPVGAATTHTWTGGGSSANWSDAANWTDGAPSNGDNLIFSGTMRQINTNNLLTSVGTVTFNEGGYTLAGNNLTLNGNIGNNGNNTWAVNLIIGAARTIESYAGTSGGTLTVSGTVSLGSAGSVVLNANHTTGNDGNLTVSGIISGTGTGVAVTKGGSGAGTVTLSGTNTYSGKTVINSGFLAVSRDDNLGVAPSSVVVDKIQFNGGYLLATASFTLNTKRGAKITAAGATTGLWADDGVTLTYGGIIAASGSFSYDLSLDGEGTIALSGNSTYLGKTKVIVATARISHAGAFGKSALGGGDRVEVNALSTVELTGGITVPKAMIMDYATLVNLSGNNEWAGAIVLGINSSGKSVIRSSQAGSTLSLSSVSMVTDTVTDPVNSFQNLFLEGAGDIDIIGVIDGDGTDGAGSYLLGHGDVVMDGTGTLTLSGENTYSGRTLVNSGMVAISADDNLGAVPGTTSAGRVVINGGTVEFLASFTLNGSRGIALGPTTGSGTGAIQVDPDVTVDYAGIIADNDGGNDNLIKTGAGTLALLGANTFSGATTINEGSLRVNNTTGSGTGSGAVTVNETGILGGNGTISGAVTIKSGGRVEPGATIGSVGTLHVGGDVSCESGATYQVEIGSGTSCDKLDLKGTGSLALGSGVSILEIGTVTGAGRIIAINVKRNDITGEFRDTDGNLLENNTALHLSPNSVYFIHYVNKKDSDDGYIELNTVPTAAEGLISILATPSGVMVEFQTTEEAALNDIVLFLYRDDQWVEVGRQPAVGEGSHSYRFVVPGLNAGDIVNLLVQDDEGRIHTANQLTVGSFNTQVAQITQVNASGLTLLWKSIPGSVYDIYRAEQLNGTWTLIQTIDAAQTQTEVFIAFEPNQRAGYFKIGVR
jgi:fibronectin-binding autotransporter adhesin